MKRPTSRSVLLVGIGVLLLLAATTAQAGWLFVLAAGTFALPAGSLAVAHRLKSCEVGRELPARVAAGDEVAVRLSVRNVGDKPVPAMRIEDLHPALEPAAAATERLDPGAAAALETVRVAPRRGVFPAGEIRLVSGAPFGILRSRRVIDVPSPTIVVPRHVELRSFPLLEPSSFPSDVLHERARTGAGEEFLGVREYRPGDARKAIHWRSTARAGRLIVREYEQEVLTRVALVVGGIDHGAPPDSSFEVVVAAAASVALYALVTGHPVELHAPHEARPSELFEPNRLEILDWLAALAPRDTSLRPHVERALRRLGRRGTVVVACSTGGVAGIELNDTVRRIQAAGARAIVVAARAGDWSPADSALAASDGDVLRTLGVGRSRVRILERGRDLSACLQV
ncbi:MAG TPA: DUF58 domain-containing protein [Actinomycetota bacterium]|nr:DUF58 domain-containing protein [Actinomycetota bacterium]